MKTYLKAVRMNDRKEYEVYQYKNLYYVRLGKYCAVLSKVNYEPSPSMYYSHFEFNGHICQTYLTSFENFDFLPMLKNFNQLSLF
jgi:hypothetical protein